jgi:hypothetical protein
MLNAEIMSLIALLTASLSMLVSYYLMMPVRYSLFYKEWAINTTHRMFDVDDLGIDWRESRKYTNPFIAIETHNIGKEELGPCM